MLFFNLIKQNIPGKISFTLDCWTSPNAIPFLGITSHFINSDWKLNDILIDFVHLSGSHSGENLANAFLNCIHNDFNILNKVMLYNFYYLNKILI